MLTRFKKMTNKNKILFILFFISGFCGLVYQVVWVRMAYSAFGVITPVMSVIISVFMLGLSIGSWAGGKWIAGLRKKFKLSAIIFYALTEIFIGIGAFAIPKLFSLGEHFLLTFGEMNSFRYLFFSAVTICISILPWCILMGFTFPFMMAYIREIDNKNTQSFSYLYFANVIGAMFGTLLAAVVLMELFGFKNTLFIAAGLNFTIAFLSFFIGFRNPNYNPISEDALTFDGRKIKGANNISLQKSIMICSILFASGFISMSMEVVWIRAFTPILKTRTYSFASLLTVYLFATWIGSYIYRKHLNNSKIIKTDNLLTGIAISAILPVILNDPRLNTEIPVVLMSICPICIAFGYLTPKLIDRYSSGRPDKAGKVYALNILGCILGPLFASYILLPSVSVRMSIILLGIPFLLLALMHYYTALLNKKWSVIMIFLTFLLFLHASLYNKTYEEIIASHPGSETRRDHTATVISVGQRLQKQLLVNGIGITQLTPITKVMAHLPLSFCKNNAESALVICFGMGVTYRSLLSWNIKTTAIELVPSVKDAFKFYHDDAETILKNPNGQIIIDDGRRFLKRTNETFDVITIDPPPPIEAAGSSLLYSEEFYQIAKLRLKNGGILHQWFPFGEFKILQAMARSLSNSFPYIKIYKSVENWGFHFIASTTPIENLTVVKMISRMPETARSDLLEWYKPKNLERVVEKILSQEIPLDTLLSDNREIVITDAKPYNEYYILRRFWDKVAKL